MKKTLTISLFLAFMGFFAIQNLQAVNHAPLQKRANGISDLTSAQIIQLDRKEVELKIHRKLTFKERIVLRILKKKLKNNKGKAGKMDTMSIIGFAAAFLGIIGMFVQPLIWLIFSIAAIVFGAIGMSRTKKDPSLRGRGLAIAGLVLGIITLVLPFVAFAAILSTF